MWLFVTPSTLVFDFPQGRPCVPLVFLLEEVLGVGENYGEANAVQKKCALKGTYGHGHTGSAWHDFQSKVMY